MKNYFNTIKHGVVFSLAFFLTLGVLYIVYAATYSLPTKVGTGSGLSSGEWNKMVDSIDYLKTTSDSLQTQINTINTPKYRFKANLGAQFNVNGLAVIPFSAEEYDIGNIYNTSTYTVTIPKTGLYEFCTNVLTYTAGSPMHFLINGGIPLGYSGITGRITVSGCNINNYTAGNTVRIETHTGDIGILHTGSRSTFYGRLLE